MIELICKECGKHFNVTENRAHEAKFCSRICAQAERVRQSKETRICSICGKSFIVNKSSPKTMCSKQCANEAKKLRVEKTCKHCGKTYWVMKSVAEKSNYCCRQCANNAKKGVENTICDFCRKSFHRKPSHALKNKHGNFCSKKCLNEWKKISYLGENNHQYGLKGPLNASFKGKEISVKNNNIKDILIYCPEHPFANSAKRVKKHRFIVEQNHNLFSDDYFIIINNNYYLKPDIVVHHLDCNHNNNDINNLIPCTVAEHTLYHSLMKMSNERRKEIINNITAVLKQGELLGNPEVDNQQPSQPLTKLEGSETNG